MTNFVLLMAALFAQAGTGGGGGIRVEGRMQMSDRIQGAMPVSDKFILPPKVPDCRTQSQVDAAVQAKRLGDAQQCDTERFLKGH